MPRQLDGRETWHRLLGWDKGQAPAERLAAQILISERFESIDPSHPLGGKDGLKDIICSRNSKKLIAACYFPRGQQSMSDIKTKLADDSNGIATNNADGLIFITNQELRLGEREELNKIVGASTILELYHLERIAAILNSPTNYGLRLEFLDIEMTKEEQLSFMASKEQAIHDLTNAINQILPRIKELPTNADAIEVMPETYIGVHSPYMQVIKPYHKCSYCGYGFRIFGRDSLTSAMVVSAIPYTGGVVKYETVTCPKCGNVEQA